MFVPEFDIQQAIPAPYNPRRIDDDARGQLSASLTDLGMVKPVIVADNNIIVAGHQRTNTAKMLGWKTIPAFIISGINTTDEIRFNQLHNGTDLDGDSGTIIRVPPANGRHGFHDIPHDEMEVIDWGAGVIIRKEVCRLIIRYGDWGGAVAGPDGMIVSGNMYAAACKQISHPCRVFYIPAEKVALAEKYFSMQFGEFSYDHIPRNTWMQSLAQPNRLAEGASRSNESKLYREHVLKQIKPGDRVLDFGCGFCRYVPYMRERGIKAYGVEFFLREGDEINTTIVRRNIRSALNAFREDGPFDVVVCEAVINSVDTVQAESDVLTTVNAFCKPGGTVFASGRLVDNIQYMMSRDTLEEKRSTRYIEFLDENGLSATYRHGMWTFQKFHSKEEIRRLMTTFVGSNPKTAYKNTLAWFTRVEKDVTLPREQVEAALRREFNLPWPNGMSVGMADEAVEAILG